MAVNELNPDNLTGPQKAAIFLLALGEKFTGSFFKKLDEGSITKIGKYMSEITYIPSDIFDRVMDDYFKNLKSSNLAVSGKDFLEQVVKDTLDDETAREVFNVIGNKGPYVPFSELTYIPAENVANIFKGEHPQTIALLLSYLPEEKAAKILSLLPDGMKSDIALRIVKIGSVQDELIKELDQIIKKEISNVGKGSKRKFDGINTLANILNEVDRNTEEDVLSQIEKEDSDLADKIRQKMFIFEDLFEVEDRNFREILQNVDNQTLAKALKTATEEMKQKIFKNLSERAADMLKEDVEVMGPVKLSHVEEAQQSLIKTAKSLEAEGKIVIAGKGEDVFV